MRISDWSSDVCSSDLAFLAIRAGAHALKLFPAEAASPKVVKAQRAVWPSHIPQLVVGGVTTDTMADYLAAGADGFGLGSWLYRSGPNAEHVSRQASAFVQAISNTPLLKSESLHLHSTPAPPSLGNKEI